jgi:hypothetical protein
MTQCPHDRIEPAGIASDRGGQVHELALCRTCEARLFRVSPLHDWSCAEDPPAELLDH